MSIIGNGIFIGGGSSGGLASNVREMPWASYRQLTNAQKTNGTIYLVPDYTEFDVGLEVTHMPNKVTFDDSDVDEGSNVYTGDGLVITFTDDGGYRVDVTSNCSYTISTGSDTPVPLSGNYTFPSNPTEDDIIYTVHASYVYSGTTYSTEFELTLLPDIAHEEPVAGT